MLDSGSDRDVIDERLVKELSLKKKSKQVTITTVDSNASAMRHFVSYRIEAFDGSYSANVDGALVGNLIVSDNDLPPSKRNVSKLQHAEGVEFIDIDSTVSMIIGVSHAEAWMGATIRRGRRNQPALLKCAFGWTLVGGWKKDDSSSIACNATSVDDNTISSDFSRIFYHDLAPVTEGEMGYSGDRYPGDHGQEP